MIAPLNSLWGIAYSVNNLLATVSVERTIKLWDVDGGYLLNVLDSHLTSVKSVAFNYKNWLATASTDGVIKLWTAQ